MYSYKHQSTESAGYEYNLISFCMFLLFPFFLTNLKIKEKRRFIIDKKENSDSSPLQRIMSHCFQEGNTMKLSKQIKTNEGKKTYDIGKHIQKQERNKKKTLKKKMNERSFFESFFVLANVLYLLFIRGNISKISV